MRGAAFLVLAIGLGGCGSSDGEGKGGGPSRPAAATVLAESDDLVLELAVDGEKLFWVADNMLHAVPVAGGSPVDVGASAGESLVLDETYAYFAGGIRGTVGRLPKSGGAFETIVTGQKEPTSVAVDASGVYFANWSSYTNGPVADGSIVRTDLDGSNVTALAEGLIYPRGLALGENDLFFVSASDGNLYRLPKTGGTPVVVMGGLNDPGPPVLDDSAVYVRTRPSSDDPEGNDEIVRVGFDGSDASVVVSERLGIADIGAHEGFVYYTRSGGVTSCDRPSGVVRRVPTSGGTARDIAVEQSDPALLAVDESGVYWSNGSSSSHACKNLARASL
jgi:hypothetical protein